MAYQGVRAHLDHRCLKSANIGVELLPKHVDCRSESLELAGEAIW
jgi:hypothetical protein